MGNALTSSATTSDGRVRTLHFGDLCRSVRQLPGEQLQVIGEQPYGAEITVKTKIIKSNGETVSLDYRMRENAGSRQISDVYMDGSISQLATQRSEFHSILQREGIDGLIIALNRKVDLLTRNVAKAS